MSPEAHQHLAPEGVAGQVDRWIRLLEERR